MCRKHVCKIHKLLGSAKTKLSSGRENACGDVYNGGMYYYKSFGGENHHEEDTGLVKASRSAVPVMRVLVCMGNRPLFFLRVGLRFPVLDFLFIGGSLRRGIFSLELSDGGEGV